MQDAEHQPLPPMSDALLTDEQLASLFRDYRQCAESLRLLVKPGPGFVPAGPEPSLDEVETLLRERRIRGLQVRYRYDDLQWFDTLMVQPSGVRLIRISHPPAPDTDHAG
jgi:hypothetical protein